MKNLLHKHPCPEVRAAAIRLMDALSSWNRNTGREHMVIIKDSIGCEIRVLTCAPLPEHVTDEQLLESFANLSAAQNA